MYSKFIAGSIITAAFLFAGAYASDQPAMAGEKIDISAGTPLPSGELNKQQPELAHMAAPEMAPAVMAVAKKSK